MLLPAFLPAFAVFAESAFPQNPAETSGQESFQQLEMDGNVAMYEGRMRKVADDVLARIPDIQKGLENRLGLKADFPVTVVIYKDAERFTRLTGNSMIAAFARTGREPEREPGGYLVALNYPAVSSHPLDLSAVLTHELCHLLLHRHIPGRALPKWFDEGVSEWASGGITELIHPATGDVLRRAVLGNRLIPFYRLETRFPQDETGFRLAYEQSGSFVTFIVKTHGEDSLRGILARLAGGATFPEAVEAELLLSPSGLEAAWEKDLKRRPAWIQLLANNIYVIVFLLAGAATVAGFLRLRIRMKTYEDEEEEEGEEGEEGENSGTAQGP